MDSKREVDLTLIKENEDGSAVYNFDFSDEELTALTRLGIITALKAGLDEAKKYDPDYVDQDGFAESMYKDDNNGYVLKAKAGYNSNVDILCTIDDTNNGYITYIPSYSSSMQDNYICMDYSEADYLRKLLNFIHEQK